MEAIVSSNGTSEYQVPGRNPVPHRCSYTAFQENSQQAADKDVIGPSVERRGQPVLAGVKSEVSPSRDGICLRLRLVLSLGFRTEACVSLSAMTKWDNSPHRWRN
jgi:hypothetical protein